MTAPAPTCDVVIIGAGPAGISAAIWLRWLGRSVQVVDRAEFPRDKCCGDGLTTLALRELERLQFHPRDVTDWHPLAGATLRSPGGHEVRLTLPETPKGLFAAVAPRRQLDHALVEHARSVGVPVWEGWSLDSVEQQRRWVRVGVHHDGPDQTRSATITARYVIGADGAWSPTRRAIGAVPNQYRGDWQATRQYFDNVTGAAAETMMIWFEPDLLPGYAWSFPLPSGRANVGFGVLRDPPRTGAVYASLWESLIGRSHIASALGPTATPSGRRTAWPIPARVDGLELSDHRVLFAGDAAAAADLLTGEGIGQALLSGRLAAQAVNAAGSDESHVAGSLYRRSMRRELFADHSMSRRLSSLITSPVGAERALSVIAHSGTWGRGNFARWLFEDEPRGILMTPRRWHRRFLSRTGAYQAARTVRSNR